MLHDTLAILYVTAWPRPILKTPPLARHTTSKTRQSHLITYHLPNMNGTVRLVLRPQLSTFLWRQRSALLVHMNEEAVMPCTILPVISQCTRSSRRYVSPGRTTYNSGDHKLPQGTRQVKCSHPLWNPAPKDKYSLERLVKGLGSQDRLCRNEWHCFRTFSLARPCQLCRPLSFKHTSNPTVANLLFKSLPLPDASDLLHTSIASSLAPKGFLYPAYTQLIS